MKRPVNIKKNKHKKLSVYLRHYLYDFTYDYSLFLRLCQAGRDLQQYQSQAKQLCRKLNAQSPDRCTLEAGDMDFQ